MIPIVLSVGTCNLDKEIYHEGETPLYSCICSSPIYTTSISDKLFSEIICYYLDKVNSSNFG